MHDNANNMIDIILKFIQVLVLLISAVWAYMRFRKEDPLFPRIEFSVDCKMFGPQKDSYLAAFTISAHNKGNVEHRFSEIRLRVLGIKAGEALTEFEKYPSMVRFPEELMKAVNVVPPSLEYFFVRPGINQHINYSAKISADIRFIIV